MNPTKTKAWTKIQQHFNKIENKHITNYFNQDRLQNFSFDFNSIYFDFSKHRLDEKILELFSELAKEMQLESKMKQLFSGNIINHTEQRAVLHTALRQQDDTPIFVNKKNIIPEIRNTYKRLENFSDKIISGNWKGHTGKKITDVVNIGIGGSDLGPKMMVQALSDYKNHLNIHYLSNIDPFGLDKIIKNINMETTLFLVVSKSFSTQETLTNAKSIQALYIDKFGKESIAKHFATISTQVTKAQDFGISPENIFPMWDWVGGRYSLWSPAGISIMLAVGIENFNKMLSGAANMDLHFKQTDFNKNIPAVSAFISILYNNFYEFETETCIPYAEKLQYLPDFLQQLMMESNGKTVDNESNKIDYQTGDIIWGNVGTNAQHSFFQLLHQGSKIVPVCFMAEKANNSTKHTENHLILLSNMIAQAEALMQGEQNANPYKNFEGNRPSSTILLDKITPETMGTLVAYYEHKTFVEGIIWNINSFDQFGVELGKKLANKVLNELQGKESNTHDFSTDKLISLIKK